VPVSLPALWNADAMGDLYFAYGSNMSRARLAARIHAPEFVCVARFRGWRLVFNKPGRDGSGKANLVPHEDAQAFGIIWRIAATDWPSLDAFEPGYERHRVDVHDEGGALHGVHAYLHPARGAALTPHAWYVEHLLEGAREHGLPEALLTELHALPRS
jgi:gamma-glutamylcyclotransferase